MAQYSGKCLCGDVEYEADVAPIWTALCHCETCKRACSAPVVAWISFKEASIKWSGQLSYFKSSEHGTRGFCGKCGSPMSFSSTRWKGQIHLYATSLHNAENYKLHLHCYFGEKFDWLGVNDELPKFEASATLQ